MGAPGVAAIRGYRSSPAPSRTRAGASSRPPAASLSELFSAYSITLDADRASSAATNHALQLAATDLEYEVTRVKSPVLGRDLNPFGRGDGTYYCNGSNIAGGSLAISRAKPCFLGQARVGLGNGMNNVVSPGYDWLGRILLAQEVCPLHVVTCPAYIVPWPDPCEGLDTWDPWVFCCECMPLMCPECWPCPPTTGCCYIKLPGFGPYCAHKPPEEPLKPPEHPWDCDKIESQCALVRALYHKIYIEVGCGIIGKAGLYQGRKAGFESWNKGGCKALEGAYAGIPPGPPPYDSPGFERWCYEAYWTYGRGNALCPHEAECCP